MRINTCDRLSRVIHPRQLWLIACGCALAFTAPAGATDVWVITDAAHPVKGVPDMRLIELDAPARIEAELTRQLPSDPTSAAVMVQQRLKKGGTDLQQRLARAYQGVTDAWSLGIAKIPAVVVDRRYVVYGEVDVSHALAKVDRHRSARR